MSLLQQRDAPLADLRRFQLAHLALRVHGEDICRGLAAMAPGDTERGQDLGRLWAIYQAGLRGHDSSEDGLCWPVVVERDPGFAPIQADMERQHKHLAELLSTAAIALERMAANADRSSIADSVESMDTLVKAAEQHFLDEEDRALPRLAVVFTADDMAALERRRRTLPKEMRATFLAAEEGAARRMGGHDLIAS